MSASLDSQFSLQLCTQDVDGAPEAQGIHLPLLRMYIDFSRLGTAQSSASRLQEIVTQAKDVASNPARHDVPTIVAALRRKATVHLICNQARRALSTAEQMIKLKFDWPYGHLVKADALLAMGQYAAACHAYQLAQQLMRQPDPTDDFGRAEVAEHLNNLTRTLAAKSCLTLTYAHTCEVTACAAWPSAPPKRKRSSTRRMHSNARDLQDSVTHAVNSALEAISRDGAMSHVQLHSEGSPEQQRPAQHASTAQRAPESPTWGVLSGASDGHAASAGSDGGGGSGEGTLDQLLANQMRRERAAQRSGGSGGAGRGSQRDYLQMLDTAASSKTDCSGLRTTTSDLDFKTHTSMLQVCALLACPCSSDIGTCALSRLGQLASHIYASLCMHCRGHPACSSQQI